VFFEDLGYGLVLNHQNGISFYGDYSDPKLEQQYHTYCVSLTLAGVDPSGVHFFIHDDSDVCNCQSTAANEPCVPQPQITSPPSLAGYLEAWEADDAKRYYDIFNDISTSVVPVIANSSNPSDGCGPLLNAALVAGNIALAFRGDCYFQTIADNANAAGAVAVLVANTPNTDYVRIYATGSLPIALISYTDGIAINSSIANGVPVAITIGAHTGNLSVAGNLTTGLLTFEPTVFNSTGTAIGTPNTGPFDWALDFNVDFGRYQLWVVEPNGVYDLIQVFDVHNAKSPVLLANITGFDNNTQFTDLLDYLGDGTFTTIGTKTYLVQAITEKANVTVLDVTNLTNIVLYRTYENEAAFYVAFGTNKPNIGYAGLFASIQPVPGVDLLDISSATAVVSASLLAPAGTHIGTSVESLGVVGNVLYVSWGSDGLYAFNVSGTTPTFLASIKTVSVNGTLTEGVFKVDPIDESHVIILNFDGTTYSIVGYELKYPNPTSTGGASTIKWSVAVLLAMFFILLL
jgi:hypothetical protein